MKRLIILLTIALLSTACATTLPPAGPTDVMIDQADTIILKTDQSPEKVYKAFAQHLAAKGFGFENTDETLMIIKTDYKEGSKLAFTFAVNASIKVDGTGSLITINGKAENPTLGKFEPANAGMEGSLIKVAWNDLYSIATSFDHSKIMYARN